MHTLFLALLGHPWHRPESDALPRGLSGFVITTRQWQELMQLFTLLAFLEPRLDQAKVAVLDRLTVDLQVEPGVVPNLEEVCRGHGLRAFGNMYRRTFNDLNSDGVVQCYACFILPMLGLGIDHEHLRRLTSHAICSVAPPPSDQSGTSTGSSGSGSRGPSQMCGLI